MSLEDAIKEVAKAIQSHADAIREDIAQRKADTAALSQLMRAEYEEGYSEEDENEPAPVVSLAEKRKEKQAAEPLKSELIAEAIKDIRPDGNAPNSQELPGKTYAEHAEAATDLNVPAVVDAAEAQRMLDESLTDDYVIECFKKSIATQGKPKTAEIMKKYGATGKLLDSIGRVSITRDKWADLCREFLG